MLDLLFRHLLSFLDDFQDALRTNSEKLFEFLCFRLLMKVSRLDQHRVHLVKVHLILDSGDSFQTGARPNTLVVLQDKTLFRVFILVLLY